MAPVFCQTATNWKLDASFRTRLLPERKVECYVNVEGHLGTIQTFEHEIVEDAIVYVRAVGRPLTLTRQVILPCVNANRDAVAEISAEISNLVGLHRQAGIEIRLSPLSLAGRIRRVARQRKPRDQIGRVIKAIVGVKDDWTSGRLSGRRAVILADQVMEEMLKAKLQLPPASRDGIAVLAHRAEETGFLTGRERYRLVRFHRMRNRVQHRGASLRGSHASAMFEFYIDLLNRKLGG